MKEYSDKNMFAPVSNRDIRRQYPELQKISEFAFDKLTPKEMLFVYYYCAYYKEGTTNNRERIVKSVKVAFGDLLSQKDKESYYNGNLPQNIRLAITRWDKFDLSVRLQAKVTIDKIFDNIQNMIDVNEKDFKDKDNNVDFNKKKQYVDTCMTISESLINLVRMKEEGFGVNDNTPEQERKQGGTLLEEWHKEQEQN